MRSFREISLVSAAGFWGKFRKRCEKTPTSPVVLLPVTQSSEAGHALDWRGPELSVSLFMTCKRALKKSVRNSSFQLCALAHGSEFSKCLS